MKKKTIAVIVIVCVLLVAAAGIAVGRRYMSKQEEDFFSAAKDASSAGKTVVATVDGKNIYREDVEFLKAANRLSAQHLPAGTASIAVSAKSDQEILDQLIQNEVLLKEAEKKNLEYSLEEAKKQQKIFYDNIMQANDEQTEFLKNYLSEMGLDEEGYLQVAAKGYRDLMTRSNLYNDYISHLSAAQAADPEAAFQSYVTQLVSQASVSYS